MSSMKIHQSVRESLAFGAGRVPTPDEVSRVWGPPATLAAPKGSERALALDSALDEAGVYSLIQHSRELGVWGVGAFMGYGALQQVAQSGIIRACIETVADDMTRAWIELVQDEDDKPKPKPKPQPDAGLFDAGEDDLEADKEAEEAAEAERRIAAINREFKRLRLQDVLHEACCLTGYYGGCLLFLDTGAQGEDLALPLSLEAWGLEAGERGFLRGVRCIDPVNVSPGLVNYSQPLRADYYVPQSWYVLGQEVHASRLLRVYANEPPLLARPSYNFLGIPQAQLLWDYCAHFQSNRDSSNRLLDKFSQMVMKTAMTDLITGGAADVSNLQARLALLSQNRSNDGIIAIDKDAEDMVKLETPLAGVTDIVRQSLEIIAALNRTPAVKLLGISPSGFNSTGESDIRNYYDHVASQQEKVLRPALARLLQVVQRSLFGEVDSKINFNFCPLSEEDESAKETTRQIRINNLMALLDHDVLSPDEVRRLLAGDPDSGLDGIDPEMPEELQQPGPDEMGMGGEPGMPGLPGMPGEQEAPMAPAGPGAPGQAQEKQGGERRPSSGVQKASAPVSPAPQTSNPFAR